MGARVFIILAGCTIATACTQAPRNDAGKSEQQIRAMYAHWAKSFEARDLDGVMAMYAPNVVAYDVVPPLQYKGADAYRKDYTEFFGQFAGPVHVDLADTAIDVGADIGFAHGIERMTGKATDGTPVDIWLRWTDGLKRIDGQWRVVHEHISVPVDMATGKARLDLKP